MKLSLCVVGCGGFAKKFAQAMGSLRSEVDLYFASRDLQRAETYAKTYDGSGAFGSYEEAAADPRVEAMYICTPHHLHREHTVMAARAGKHILVEKPIARTLEEAHDMVAEARQAGVTFMVAENFRFMSAVRSAKDLVDAGALGSLRMVQLQEEGDWVPQQWRSQRDLNGGGAFIDGGIHKVDVLVYLAGMPQQVFAASMPKSHNDTGAEDGVVLMTTSLDGVVGVINHSWSAAKQPGPPWVTVSGSGGRIYFEVGAPWLKLDDGREERTLHFDADQKGLAPMVREFRDSIVESREPLTSGAAAIDDLSVVLKAYESIERGVSLPLD